MEYVLRTNNLTKRFGQKKAVSNVNMTIRPGDIYGFIGKNGAGKTTLMRLVLGAAIPTSGSVELFDGEELNFARNRIGSLLETPNLYKSCSAFENLKRFSLLTDNSDDDIRGILHFVGLSDTGSKAVSNFSLGMKQRLGIAIAMLGHPDFLILDEPINGLDPEGIRSIRDLILKLNQELGMTVLVSSHLLDELSKIVTTYGIISSGVLVEQISAEELNARCSRKLLITTDDPELTAALVRDTLGDVGISIEENTVSVNSQLERSGELNTILVNNGITVYELIKQAATLESYFFERTGR